MGQGMAELNKAEDEQDGTEQVRIYRGRPEGRTGLGRRQGVKNRTEEDRV